MYLPKEDGDKSKYTYKEMTVLVDAKRKRLMCS